MQSYLADKGYSNVAVYCAGRTCRNNVGSWSIKKIEVDPKLKGRAFYTQKDKAMAAHADFGLILWDGKSEGSINNVFELLRNGKKAVVYFLPRKEFMNVKTPADADTLLRLCEPTTSSSLQGSNNIRQQMESLSIAAQQSMSL